MIVPIKMMDTISPEPELTAQAFYIKRLRFIVDSESTSDSRQLRQPDNTVVIAIQYHQF